MPFAPSPVVSSGLSPQAVEALLAHHERRTLPRFRALWTYYRNPLTMSLSDAAAAARPGAARRPYRLGQERGLPFGAVFTVADSLETQFTYDALGRTLTAKKIGDLVECDRLIGEAISALHREKKAGDRGGVAAVHAPTTFRFDAEAI